ncbi:MAG: hypothetical protein NT147_10935 [Candidatus Aminicenantes bacterium]|nr:hypothetical protein [Candidatus Aminicenantes bacterium]
MRQTALAILAALFLTSASGFTAVKPRIALAGYWKWSGVNYTWVEGRWVKVKANRAWVRGNWKLMGSFWAWTPGRWDKINIGEPKPAKKKKK